jgi:hypothetical protein
MFTDESLKTEAWWQTVTTTAGMEDVFLPAIYFRLDMNP